MSRQQQSPHCSASCLTQDHASWGECVRAKSLHVAYCQDWKGQDYTRQKKWDANLADYKRAREEGMDPKNTWPAAVKEAREYSDRTGEAFIAQ